LENFGKQIVGWLQLTKFQTVIISCQDQIEKNPKSAFLIIIPKLQFSMHDFELVSKFLTGYNQLNLHVAVVCVVVCKHAHTHTRKVKDNDQIFLAV